LQNSRYHWVNYGLTGGSTARCHVILMVKLFAPLKSDRFLPCSLNAVAIQQSFFQPTFSMTLITRFGAALLLIAALLPFVAAKPGHPNSSSCKNDEFWYDEKKCCLPLGGPPSHPEPPPEKKCPHTGWSWNKEQSCCVPHYPLPPSHPSPQCPKDWDWFPATFCCQQSSHHPSPPPPAHSGGYGGWKRASHKSRTPQICPQGLSACPIMGTSGLTGDLECLDTANELESCGGCASIGQGQDCTSIKGAWNVACEQGSCTVYTCAAGFRRSDDGKSCISI